MFPNYFFYVILKIQKKNGVKIIFFFVILKKYKLRKQYWFMHLKGRKVFPFNKKPIYFFFKFNF